MQPDGAALWCVLRCIIQKIGDYALDLGRIECKWRQLVIGQEIQSEAALLKAA
jgi:hypothetical protein